jgi:hypothetical protein
VKAAAKESSRAFIARMLKQAEKGWSDFPPISVRACQVPEPRTRKPAPRGPDPMVFAKKKRRGPKAGRCAERDQRRERILATALEMAPAGAPLAARDIARKLEIPITTAELDVRELRAAGRWRHRPGKHTRGKTTKNTNAKRATP